MLYEIIIIALSVFIPISTYQAFKAGYNAARQIHNDLPITQPRPPTKAKPQPETEAQRKARIMQENIEGFGKPGYRQQVIK